MSVESSSLGRLAPALGLDVKESREPLRIDAGRQLSLIAFRSIRRTLVNRLEVPTSFSLRLASIPGGLSEVDVVAYRSVNFLLIQLTSSSASDSSPSYSSLKASLRSVSSRSAMLPMRRRCPGDEYEVNYSDVARDLHQSERNQISTNEEKFLEHDFCFIP